MTAIALIGQFALRQPQGGQDILTQDGTGMCGSPVRISQGFHTFASVVVFQIDMDGIFTHEAKGQTPVA